MGNWVIIIEGTGPHHNNNENDADNQFSEFVTKLLGSGQRLKRASFTNGVSYALNVETTWLIGIMKKTMLIENKDFRNIKLPEFENYATLEFLRGPYKNVIVVFDKITIAKDIESEDQILQFEFAIRPHNPDLHASVSFKNYIAEALTVSICNHLGEPRQPED